MRIGPVIPLNEHMDQFTCEDIDPPPNGKMMNEDIESNIVNDVEKTTEFEDVNDMDSVESNEDDEQDQGTTTRSGRKVKPPSWYNEFVGYGVHIIPEDAWYTLMASNAFVASTDPDVMYLDEALKASDAAEFIKAMRKEVKWHIDNRDWVIVDQADIPDIPVGKSIVPAVWAMRRKRDISTREVYKWKARLNYHGGKQTKGIDYWETYAPVAAWSSIRIIMLIALFNYWYTKQLDFVLAFPQAPEETELYMAIPPGFTVEGDPKKKALKLLNNLYGQKQAGRVWNKY